MFAAVLCHTTTALLLPIIFAGVLAASYAERQPVSGRVLLVFLAAGACIAGFFAVYLWPLMRGWNQGQTWGYSVGHSILASANMIGWPVFLLAILGGLLLWHERRAENWYWATCAIGWGAAAVLLPRIVTFQPAYVFPFALTIVLLAGCAIGRLYEYLQEESAWLAATGAALLCLVNLPSLASHYVDGSRPDMRTAARFVEKNWRPGDRVAGFSMGLFGHYAPNCNPRIPLPADATKKLETLAAKKGRFWVVVQSARGGLSEDLRRWLGTHCSYELEVQHKRFDYPEYTVDVFLHHSTVPPRREQPRSCPRPFISVIMPVRNQSRFIERTLTQLAAQDYDPERFEIVVVDGQSADGTPERVAQFARRHGNVHLYANPRRLGSAARNVALRHARGDIVVIVDGHCELDDNRYLTKLASAFERSGADCVGRPQPLDVCGSERVAACHRRRPRLLAGPSPGFAHLLLPRGLCAGRERGGGLSPPGFRASRRVR